MKENLLDEFKWRGMLYDQTEGIQDLLAKEKVTAYTGFDPTGASLHVGSLLPIMGLVQLQRHGHTPLALVGGATGMIGDPSGKSSERTLLSTEILEHNVSCIRKQLARFLDFECTGNPAQLLNNADWLGGMKFVDFMRDVGKHFSVSVMLSKESVKRRIHQEGISFTEFSYMLLQAYDFYYLNKHQNCAMQMGGSDQWGNITAGTDLIRRLSEQKAHGLVYPLVTNSSGVKFGKTESGAVWLDAEMTSPYRFYQFWFNTNDEDALRYLKFFTLMEEEEVAELAASQAADPGKRDVQRALAADVTRRVHGQDALDGALQASKAFFGGSVVSLSARDIEDIFDGAPSTEQARTLFNDGYTILDLLVACGITKSKGEARRTIQGGGIYLNNVRVEDIYHTVTIDDAVDGRFIVLRKGGKKYHLVKVMS